MNMKISINGAVRDVPEGLSVPSLLALLNIPGDRVAIELNRRIIRKAEWPATVLADGDRVEIVTFVGGGSL